MIHAEFLPWLSAGPSLSATRSAPEVIAAWIALGGVIITLAVTVVLQFSGGRRTSRDTQKALKEQREQLNKTLAEQRTQSLNERFATATDKLGSDKSPAVRLAGVYAMAGLADDWEKNRQTCVDVLCAYLRLPYDPDPGEDAAPAARAAYRADREVRHTVVRVITAHLRTGAPVSWQDLNFDFTGVVFDGGNFAEAEFSGGTVRFAEAEFSGGEISFLGAGFSGGMVDFSGASFAAGTVDFSGARFAAGTVDFSGARFSGGAVDFSRAGFTVAGTVDFSRAIISGGKVCFSEAEFSGGTICFSEAEFSGGAAYFSEAKFSCHTASFIGARFSGGAVDFSRAKFSGTEVCFSRARFSGGAVVFSGALFELAVTISFSEAEFYPGGEISFLGASPSRSVFNFGGAIFSGGTVDFSDWSSPLVSPGIDTSSPGLKLPEKIEPAGGDPSRS